MKQILDQFILKTNKLDKILIVLIFCFPLLLSLTIFGADLSATLVAIIILFLIVSKKEISVFYEIKKQIYFFFIFYALIILSLIFSISFKTSFLPSFFYIRYFLFIFGIFYLLKKYDFVDKILLYSLSLTFIIVISDSIYQLLFLKNFFGYPATYAGVPLPKQGDMFIITSFFNDEKKLGSYLIRLLPLLVSLFYYFNLKKLSYLYFAITGIIIFYTSERTALFLLVTFLFFYFLIIKNKIKFIIFCSLILAILFTFNTPLRFKYLNYTLMQLGIIETKWNAQDGSIVRYYSKEHEDLSYTALQIFKKNILTGSGIKSFYKACNNLKQNKLYKNDQENELLKKNIKNKASFFDRNNKLKCSTHPHNFYAQILSDTGILSFIFILLLLISILLKNIKIIFKKNLNNLDLCFYFLNVGIILNLFPLIPSGNFYNNWMSLIIFYPLGFWLFINQKRKGNE